MYRTDEEAEELHAFGLGLGLTRRCKVWSMRTSLEEVFRSLSGRVDKAAFRATMVFGDSYW
jgi:hypothetical protein